MVVLPSSVLFKLPGLKQLKASSVARSLLSGKIGPYRGRFKSSQEATESLPAARRSTYDNDEFVSINVESFSQVHSFDWPVLFFLQRLIHERALRVVTDFGGHVGVKFYAYRGLLDFPEDLRWQVVEVPAMVREGRRRVPAGVTSLEFFERLEETTACDVLICSGALQYAGVPLTELVERAPQKPKVVVLNKVPVSSRGADFFTLERFGATAIPNHIFSAEMLDEARLRLGYTLAASWTIPDRDFAVLSSWSATWVGMVGQIWAL